MFRHFTLTTDEATLVKHFNLKEMPSFSPKYNITPNEQVATVSASMAPPPRDIRFLDWGLIFNDKDVKDKQHRVATIDENELPDARYSSLLRFKRCLILADGLFLWKSENDVPRYIVRPDRQPFAFAGLREQYKSGGTSFDTCAIITTSVTGSGASAQAMPAILTPSDYDKWLSPMITKAPLVASLIRPLPVDGMESWEVGDDVKEASFKLSSSIDKRQ